MCRHHDFLCFSALQARLNAAGEEVAAAEKAAAELRATGEALKRELVGDCAQPHVVCHFHAAFITFFPHARLHPNVAQEVEKEARALLEGELATAHGAIEAARCSVIEIEVGC